MIQFLRICPISGEGNHPISRMQVQWPRISQLLATMCLLVIGLCSTSLGKALPIGTSTLRSVSVTDRGTDASSCESANTAPITSGIASQTITIFDNVKINVASVFSDAETPDRLTFSQEGLPFDLRLNPITGIIDGTIKFSDVYNVTITATDPEGLHVSTDFRLTVDPDTKKELTVTAVASPSTIAVNETGQITIKTTGGVVPYQIVGVEGPGSVSIDGLGGRVYIANLPVGVHAFTCSVKDGIDKIVSTTASITVTQPLSVTAIASPDNILLPDSTTLSFVGTGGTPPYRLVGVTGQGPYTIVRNANNTVTVSKLPFGMKIFTLEVVDSNNRLAVAQVKVWVGYTEALTVNPSASSTTISTSGYAQLYPNASGGFPFYELEVTGPGKIAPGFGFVTVSGLPSGVQTFTLTVTDGRNQKASGTVSILVVPTPPLVLDPTVSISRIPTDGSSTLFPSPSGGTPPYSSFRVDGPGTVVYGTYLDRATVSNLPVGIHSFTLTVTDSNNQKATGTVSLTVIPAASLAITPVASPNKIYPTGTSVLSPNIKGGIPPYTFDVEGPGIIGTNLATYTVGHLPVGVYSYIMTITDSRKQVVSGTVSLTVVPANRPPVVNSPVANLTVTTGQAFSINTSDVFSDPDGDSLTVTVGYLPSGVIFNGTTISGVLSQSGVTKIDLLAYDRSSAGVTSFFITSVTGSTTSPVPLAITSVRLVSCQMVTTSERRISFEPQYSGSTGQPISFSVVNELAATSSPGPYSLRVYTDNPVITLKAVQMGRTGEASFNYNWLAACNASEGTPPTSAPFSIAGVTAINCEQVTTSEYRVRFTPQYSTITNTPISFSVVNEMPATTASGPYTLRLYTDNPTITLTAEQNGAVARYQYEWLKGCNQNSRQGVGENSKTLQVAVLGNPVVGESAEIEIQGAEGQPVQVQLIDLMGLSIYQQQIRQAAHMERLTLPIGNRQGILLLKVNTDTQQQQIKLLRP